MISQNQSHIGFVKNSATQATRPRPSAMLMACRAGSIMGAPDMRPSSFRKAMMEPVKVMAPMAAPKLISMREIGWIRPSTTMWKASGA